MFCGWRYYRHIRNYYLSNSKTFQNGNGNGNFEEFNSNDFLDGTPPFAITYLINSKKLKIGIGIGKWPLINSAELHIGKILIISDKLQIGKFLCLCSLGGKMRGRPLGAIFLGFPRDFVKLPPTAQIPWLVPQVPWEILGFPWIFPQVPWEILGFPWIFPKFPKKSWDFHGWFPKFLRKSWEFHGWFPKFSWKS